MMRRKKLLYLLMAFLMLCVMLANDPMALVQAYEVVEVAYETEAAVEIETEVEIEAAQQPVDTAPLPTPGQLPEAGDVLNTNDEAEYTVIGEALLDDGGYMGIMPTLICIDIAVSEINIGHPNIPNPPHFGSPPILSHSAPNIGTNIYFGIEYTPPIGWYISEWALFYGITDHLGQQVPQYCPLRGAYGFFAVGDFDFTSNFPPSADRFGGTFSHQVTIDNHYTWYGWAPPVAYHFRLRPIPPTIEKAATILSGATAVYEGNIIEYTLTVTNTATGQGSFNGFSVWDELPVGLEIYSGFTPVVSPSTALVGSVDTANNTISATLNLPPANGAIPSETTITFRARVTDEAPVGGNIVNTAYLYNPDGEPIGDDSTTTPTIVPPVYTPTTTLRVNKVWNDNNNSAGIRPDSIQVQLRANGVNQEAPVQLNASNQWSHTFTELPVYDSADRVIVYDAIEINVPEGYRVSYSRQGNVITITNTHCSCTGCKGCECDCNEENQPQGGGRRGQPRTAPKTGDATSVVPFLSGILFSMSVLMGGNLLKKKLKKEVRRS